MSMTIESVGADGSTESEQISKDVTETTTSYSYSSPTCFLSATRFTQLALTLMENASFKNIISRGLIKRDSVFARHSLGEYSAPPALPEGMPIESLLSVFFYSGLTKQVAIKRETEGGSNYPTTAVNPSHISKTLNKQGLQNVVENIVLNGSWKLSINLIILLTSSVSALVM